MRTRITGSLTASFLLLLGLVATSPPAQAVPSFARQTGMACEACHAVFPEINHFGRVFKANAYTLDNLKPVRGISQTKSELLALSGLPPLSLMVQVSQTNLAKSLPDSTGSGGVSQNGTVAFPQQISLFYAGKIAPRLGAFIQLTYSNGSGVIGIDNTDIRYANAVLLPGDKSLIYGIDANNNPTVQDLWNSTPAFSFPFTSSNATVPSVANAQIAGQLSQSVAGLSVYAMWNESLYGELGLYRSAKQGATNALTGQIGPLDGANSNVIVGGAPYYRLAYEHQWGAQSLTVGAYGATFKLVPGGGNATAPVSLSGPANKFRDTAFDFQYQWIGDQHLVTVAGTRIKENMTLDASFTSGNSQNLKNDLTTTRVTGTYYYMRKYGGTLSYFSTTGSSDLGLYTLPVPAPAIFGVTGKPDTTGWVAELNYMPWLNTKLTAQFTQYSKFNGASSNYDGLGRNASDNNSIYLIAWLAF